MPVDIVVENSWSQRSTVLVKKLFWMSSIACCPTHQMLQSLKVRAPLTEVLGSRDRSQPLEEDDDVNYGDGRWNLRVTRRYATSSCSMGDSYPPVQERTNALSNHDPPLPLLTPGVFIFEQQILHLASISTDFRLLLLPPSTSSRNSSQIFGACRDCTKPSKCKEARTFIITESQLPLS